MLWNKKNYLEIEELLQINSLSADWGRFQFRIQRTNCGVKRCLQMEELYVDWGAIFKMKDFLQMKELYAARATLFRSYKYVEIKKERVYCLWFNDVYCEKVFVSFFLLPWVSFFCYQRLIDLLGILPGTLPADMRTSFLRIHFSLKVTCCWFLFAQNRNWLVYYVF